MHKKPQPLFPSVARAICPVCNLPSYSSSGVHPQCAMHAADLAHIRKLKALKAAEPEPGPKQPRTFERRCPRCRAIQHVRKRTCDCGYVLQITDIRQ